MNRNRNLNVVPVKVNPDLKEGITESLEVAEDGLNNLLRRVENGEVEDVEINGDTHRLIKQLRGSIVWIRQQSAAVLVAEATTKEGGKGMRRKGSKAA